MRTKASIIYLPLVKANAFIGLEQFLERKRTIIEDAVRLSKKEFSNANCQSTSEESNVVNGQELLPKKKQQPNIEVTSSTKCGKRKLEDTSTLERSNAASRFEQFAVKKQRLNIEASTSTSTTSTSDGKKNLEEPSTLARCYALVGLDHIPIHRQKQNAGTTSSTDCTTELEESFTLKRCNAVVGLDQFPLAPLKQSDLDETLFDLENDDSPTEHLEQSEFDETLFEFENDDSPTERMSSSTRSTIAKSKQMQRSMSFERLMKMEGAIQKWNANFGTKYSLL